MGLIVDWCRRRTLDIFFEFALGSYIVVVDLRFHFIF